MILRKPYAFFIKHFKLFNIILTFLEVFIIYRLGFLIQFFLEYSNNSIGAIGKDLTGTLFNNFVFIVNALVIIFSVVLISILSRKKKPIKLYGITIIANILLLILFIVCYYYLSLAETKIIDVQIAYALRDFLIIGVILELIITIMTCIRAIGFDIKNFSFGKDLEELQIDISDNEEFELQIDVDSGKFQRNLNKKKRYFKYFIYEHKFSIVLVLTIVAALSSYLIYSRMGIYFNSVKPNKIVSVDTFMMGFENGYMTSKDYKGNVISNDKTLIVIPLKIKTTSTKETLKPVNFKLVINKNKYYPTNIYDEKIKDLGTSYKNQVITKDFNTYLLVFEVPKESVNGKKYIEYSSMDDKTIKFRLNIKNIDNVEKTVEYSLGQQIKLNDSLVKDGLVVIDNYELSDKFKVDYNFCVSDNECYDSYEYIVPNFKSNYDKTVLKIDGNIILKDTNVKIPDLYDFMDKFGSIIYTVNNETKRQLIPLVRIKPQKANLKNTYYIEILDEIKEAENITLEFKVRDTLYKYKLS